MTDDAPLVLRTTDGRGVVRLTMNAGARFNPLSRAMIAALREAFAVVAEDDAARVVVLAGAGRGFSAGHDLAEMGAHAGRGSADSADSAEQTAWQRALFEECNALMEALPALGQPVIAQVHGIATAAGCQLAAMCDLVVAAEGARFALPGVNVGIFCSTPAVAVARKVGRARAMELLLTGAPIDAATALDWGLVNRVVPADGLETAVDELAASIAARPAPVVAGGKRAFYAQIEQPLSQAYATAGEAMVCDLSGVDAPEGIAAFLAKRAPVWPSSR